MFGLFKRKKLTEKQAIHPQVLVDRLKPTQGRYARVTYSTQKSTPSVNEPGNGSEDFGLSAAMGMATQNPLTGYAVGGSLSGGIVGASLGEAFTSSDTSSSSCDTSSSGYDSGSSFDSGSCGGSDSGSW